MIYIIISAAIYIVAFVALFLIVGQKHMRVGNQLKANMDMVREEVETKESLLGEIAEISLGMIPSNDYETLGQQIESLEESIRTERGRLTITEAELEAVDTRLRELEELKRELEVSNMDAVKELDMLRGQEREVKAQNEALKEQLENSMEQLEMLLTMLAHSAAAVSRLTTAKNELIETEKRAAFFEEQIAQINSKYMGLKKAYDALDIEYAQLYEKQQTAEYAAAEES
jgi:chromosome segregation ATPase